MKKPKERPDTGLEQASFHGVCIKRAYEATVNPVPKYRIAKHYTYVMEKKDAD